MSASLQDDAYRGDASETLGSYDEAILAAHRLAGALDECAYGVLLFDRPESLDMDAPSVCISQVESLQLSPESSVIVAADPDEGLVAFHVFVDEFGDMQVEIAAS